MSRADPADGVTVERPECAGRHARGRTTLTPARTDASFLEEQSLDGVGLATTHEKVRCQERVQLDVAPGQRLASTAGGVKVERPERAVAREDERP